ncbi:MAG TPA: thioredoxin [Tichowtungia sp.]|nr:thioredoxin [Tichowtungia sp.]
MKTIELSESTFRETIQSGVTLVDFWAPWCGPCKMQIPILDEVAQEIAGRATIAKVNVDDFPAPAGEYGVRGIPTLILFKDGKVVQQMVGLQQKIQLIEAIESAL